MKYFLMCTAILGSALSSCVLKAYSAKRERKNIGDMFLFNAYISVIWAILLAGSFFMSDISSIAPKTYIFGAVYGVVQCAFLFTKTYALKEGPVSLTTLVGSCAFIIVVCFGRIFFNETVSLTKLIGMALLVLSLSLCINPKNSGQSLSFKWLFSAFLFFAAGGFIGIFYKCFGASDVSDEVNVMMFIAAIVSSLLFAVSAFIINKPLNLPKPEVGKGALKYIILCGALSLLYQRLNISLSAVIPSVVFFPVSNGSVVILSTVFGRTVFKERLNKIQICGIILGLAALIVIGMA